MTDRRKPNETPAAGGWGAVNAVERHLGQQKVLVKGNRALLAMNKPGGFDCPSCAWPDPRRPHVAEYCENGAKAVAWEATRKRAGPDFFAAHTVEELKGWSDHRLEETGRLTHPLRYDARSDRYEPVSWEEALGAIGARLRGLDPERVEFYTSGRASNEAAFLWQLFGRAFGTNNFPDCSDMCHATTTTALPESIGVGKGTVSLDDWDLCDALFIIGQNPGTNSPRMMSHLHAMAKKGVPIVAFNPLRERALLRFADPQSPREMLTGASQPIASSFFQVRTGGDMLALHGVAKAVIARDDAALESGGERVVDAAFIAEHTSGFEAFADYCRALEWGEIERVSGLTRGEIEHAADIYVRATRVIACWGMGITQHADGGDALQAIVNLLLLRGNIGRPGAGACPVRGHSNVQGDRTVGINKTPTEGFLESLDRVFSIRSPRRHGHDTAQCCEAILAGEVDAFLALGGNFFRAIPDTDRIEREVGRIGLTVHMATKLNRSHLFHGREAYVLPVLGRTELDLQNDIRQSVTVEDSFSCVHASTGHLKPASEACRSEPWIVAALAQATLGAAGGIDWQAMGADYALIRERIEAVLPDLFADYNRRIGEPGGFRLPNAAAERRWTTRSGRANFLFDRAATARAVQRTAEAGLQLMTLRSHDQFNTTIYSDSDRYRGISGDRMVVFLNREDMRRAGLVEGDMAELRATYGDGVERRLSGLRVVPYDLPEGCCGAYYPEANGLLPLGHRDRRSDTPAAKSIPVTVRKAAEAGPSAGAASASGEREAALA